MDSLVGIVLMTILTCNAYANASDSQQQTRIITAPKHQNVVTGSYASFLCEAIGKPKPRILWRMNGKPLSPQKYTMVDIPDGSVLRIETVKPNVHNGTYQCFADNGVGEPVSASALLNVLSKDSPKLFTSKHNGFSDSQSDIKTNSIGDTGIYFSDTPQNDGEGSADGSDDDEDDDLDQNASGKGFDDEDSNDNIDKGSGDEPSLPDVDRSDSDILDIGSGEEPIIVSSTEKPTKKPDITKKPLLVEKEKEKESPKKETPYRLPTIPISNKDNRVPDNVPSFTVTPETSTKFFTPSTIRSKVNDFDSEDNNKLSNEVSIMGHKQVTPASFFARPGILAAVIGGAVVGLLCAILLVMFIVYRMRKKDEGSYSLDEPKRSTSANLYARGANKEFYA